MRLADSRVTSDSTPVHRLCRSCDPASISLEIVIDKFAMEEEQQSSSDNELEQEEIRVRIVLAQIKEYLKTVPYEVLLAQRNANKAVSASKPNKQRKQEASK